MISFSFWAPFPMTKNQVALILIKTLTKMAMKLFNLFGCYFSRKKKKNSVATCVLLSGKAFYQKPVENPNSFSNKLTPWPLPRSTKSDYKKRFNNVVGKNNNMMANWLVKKTPGNSSTPVSSKVSKTSQYNTILPSCERIQAPLNQSTGMPPRRTNQQVPILTQKN